MKQIVKIPSRENPDASIRVIPGHFATNHSHINYYVDMTIMKSRQSEAHAAAEVLASRFAATHYIDTIITMDGCEVIAAYLAEDLTKAGVLSLNQHKSMYIVSPEVNQGGQLLFRDNLQNMVRDRHCLLLVATATTGHTVERAIECVNYYGGMMEGIAAIFSAQKEIGGYPIHSLFSEEDLAGYRTYDFTECPLCKRDIRIDAIVNAYGYSKL